MGVAVASSSPAVAARCAHARAGVGAVASQNVTDPALGARALHLMAGGATAAEAVAILARQPHAAWRQILAVDGAGVTGLHSGPKALGTWSAARGPDVASGGNLLADPEGGPVDHPTVRQLFDDFKDGRYRMRRSLTH